MCWCIETHNRPYAATYLVENSLLPRDETRARFPAVYLGIRVNLIGGWTFVQEGALSDSGCFGYVRCACLGLGVSVPLGQRRQWVLPSRVTGTAVWSGLCCDYRYTWVFDNEYISSTSIGS